MSKCIEKRPGVFRNLFQTRGTYNSDYFFKSMSLGTSDQNNH
jgi:hypothetical protein